MSLLCKKISALSLLIATLVLPLSIVVKAEAATEKDSKDIADKKSGQLMRRRVNFLMPI